MEEHASAWVLRLDRGGWWCGRGHGIADHPLDAAAFDSPAACRAAMAEVGWVPTGPGWIEPLRWALQRNAPTQLVLVL